MKKIIGIILILPLLSIIIYGIIDSAIKHPVGFFTTYGLLILTGIGIYLLIKK